MTAYEIKYKDGASGPLMDMLDQMSPKKAAAVTGPPVRQVVRDHVKRNPRNKKGWPSTGFWEDAARGTTWDSDDTSLTVTIDKVGFSQRYYGGRISPVKAKFLTIPIASQAYGKSVNDFPGSFLITTPKGAYIVQYAGGNTDKGKFKKQNATLEFLFKLSKGVTQKENRSIIPDEATLVRVAVAAIGEYFRQIKTGGAN